MSVLWILAQIAFSITIAMIIILVTSKVFDSVYGRMAKTKNILSSTNYEHMVIKSLSVNSIMACLEADLIDAVHTRDRAHNQ
jgi:hypothetical protein